MTRPASRHPTELELEILKILWRHGPMTVREVRGQLRPFRSLAHTSVMTMLGIMTEKGQVLRRKEGSGYVYRARIRKQPTLRRMMGDLVERAFDGSAAAAAMHLLETNDLSPEELGTLRRMIECRAEEDAS